MFADFSRPWSVRWELLALVSFLTGLLPAGAQTVPSPPGTSSVRYSDYPANVYRGSVVFVDLDNADRMDLVMAGLYEQPAFDEPVPPAYSAILTHSTTLYATDPGVFDTTRAFVSRPALGLTAFYDASLAVADVNNDGRPDIAAAGLRRVGQEATPTALLVEQVGPLQFEATNPDWLPVYDGSLDWGDFNNDGLPDLLATGQALERHVTLLYQNVGGGAFQQVDVELPGIAFGEASWGDSDNDGDLDIVLSGAAEGGRFVSAVFVNDGGRFVDAGADLRGLAFGHARWMDMNDDGLLDIVLSGAYQSPFILSGALDVYHNMGNNTFSPVWIDVPGHFDGDFELIDWDSDGDVDVVASGYVIATEERPARIYRNEDGDFSLYHTVVHHQDMAYSPGDFDGDFDVDVFATGFNPAPLGLVTPTAAVWTTWGKANNLPPSAPDGLDASVSGDVVELSWGTSMDETTPTPSLTYNLRVGTTPGGVNVVSPLSDVSSGRRFICEQGNVFHNTRWPLRGVPPGTYYWSVQAVDQSCIGSEFAAESSFTVPGTSTDAEREALRFYAVLESAHPNPFHDRTAIAYVLPDSRDVAVRIYDVLGRSVKTLVSGVHPAGMHRAVWDGTNASGIPVAPGIYLYRLEGPSTAATGMLLLVR